ncbi:18813_t:CDS:2, partial [Racocetra fulgida]
KICEELPHPETRDIVLPNQSDYVSHIAVDIGGSLAKVVYFSRKPTSSIGDKIDECIEFIENLVAARRDPNVREFQDKIIIKATGGGSYKYYDKFTKKIKGVKMEKEDEMECLIKDPSPWIEFFETNLHKLVELVVKCSNNDDNGDNSSCDDVRQRATKFDSMFRKHLTLLRDRPAMYGALTVRSLLNLREQCLHELGFSDIFVKVKAEENKAALESLQNLLANIDSIQNVEDKIDFLIDNILAGNMFDWGSGQILDMLKKGELSFELAHTKIKKPEHLNQTNKFKQRIVSKTKLPLRKAVIFVDNSGADIVLGIIPFARFLISLDMDIILAANSFPAANDVTADELIDILSSVSEMDSLIAAAWASKKLTVMATGSFSPCLDLIRINEDLAMACENVDLVVLEGMGRAIHTNYNAMFTCASLKLAVFKNSIAANELGAHVYDAIVLYDEGCAVETS